METKTKDTLAEDLARAKRDYANAVKNIKERHAFRNADTATRIKMLKKYDKHTLKNRFYGLHNTDRLNIGQAVLGRALTIAVAVQVSHALNLRTCKMSGDHYALFIEIPGFVFPVYVTLIEGLINEPTDKVIMQWVKPHFPNVQSVYKTEKKYI